MDDYISSLYERDALHLSFEVYPPKKGQKKQFEIIKRTIKRLGAMDPDFISVTYGPGGTNKGKAVELSQFIRSENARALAHLTAVGYTREDIQPILNKLYSVGVRNILALRGDIPEGVSFPHGAWCDFEYAKDLISIIRRDGRFCVGAAVYPEGHPDCKDLRLNIKHMKIKVEAGADFFISQLFFDNSHYYRFLELSRDSCMHKPVIPGIMPVLRAKQISKIVKLSGAFVPPELAAYIEKYSDKPREMEKAGIDYVVKQIRDLKENGVKSIHLYTMNRWKQIKQIVELSGLV